MRGVLAFYRAGTRSLADRRMVFTFFVQIILDAFQELRQPECVHGSIKPVIKNVRDYYDCIMIIILYLFIYFIFFFSVDISVVLRLLIIIFYTTD